MEALAADWSSWLRCCHWNLYKKKTSAFIQICCFIKLSDSRIKVISLYPGETHCYWSVHDYCDHKSGFVFLLLVYFFFFLTICLLSVIILFLKLFLECGAHTRTMKMMHRLLLTLLLVTLCSSYGENFCSTFIWRANSIQKFLMWPSSETVLMVVASVSSVFLNSLFRLAPTPSPSYTF